MFRCEMSKSKFFMLAATQILTGFDRTLRQSGSGDETVAWLLLDLFQVVGGPFFSTAVASAERAEPYLP